MRMSAVCFLGSRLLLALFADVISVIVRDFIGEFWFFLAPPVCVGGVVVVGRRTFGVVGTFDMLTFAGDVDIFVSDRERTFFWRTSTCCGTRSVAFNLIASVFVFVDRSFLESAFGGCG